MDQSTPSNTHQGTQKDQYANQDILAPTIIETCILVTGPEVILQIDQFLAKQRFVVSLEANGLNTSKYRLPAPPPAEATPEPPPGTRSYHQRLHEANSTTLISRGRPLEAIGSLVKENVVLGIQNDILSVRATDTEAANTVLSTRIEGLDTLIQLLDREKSAQGTIIDGQADVIQTLKKLQKEVETALKMALELSRNRQTIIDRHSKEITALKEQSDEDQPTNLDGSHELERANTSLTTRLNETKKAHDLLLQQAAAESRAGPAQPDNRQKDKTLTNRVIQGAISASSLIRSQQVIDEQDDKIIELISENTILKRQLKEASMWKAFYKFGVSYNKEDLQKKVVQLDELATQCEQLKDQMEIQRREHAESTKTLNLTIRKDKETIEKMAATIRQDRLTKEEPQTKIQERESIADLFRRIMSFIFSVISLGVAIMFLLSILIIANYIFICVLAFFWRLFWRFVRLPL